MTLDDFRDGFLLAHRTRGAIIFPHEAPFSNDQILACLDNWVSWFDKGGAHKYRDSTQKNNDNNLSYQVALAARLYQTARLEGPTAALLWKLSFIPPESG